MISLKYMESDVRKYIFRDIKTEHQTLSEQMDTFSEIDHA
jgi:hypothetical protein